METSFLEPEQICQRFSLDEIRSATQNFDEALVVGRGGFGKVYKGFIKDGSNTVVAIKISNSMSNQGAPEFQAEVWMLSKVRHCNLVSLIGYCYKGTEMALVYEYMPEGTLEDHLHKGGAPLSWLQLLKICIGAARGLDYLHTGTGTQHGIIHRDVKSSNVLLDKNFEAKISDFGLAKIGPKNQTRTHVSTMVKGTFGYIDPRYFHTGNLTIKSDVYSFGVLLLEVICGRPAVDTSLNEDQWGLAPWVEDRIREGKLNHIIDPRLRVEISRKCLKDFVDIASQCLQYQPNQRPRMTDIVARLEVVLLLQERFNSSTTARKFIGKFWSYFAAEVESNGSNLISSPPLGNQGKQSEEADGRVKNAMVTTGKGKDTFARVPLSPQFEGNLKPFSFNVLRIATGNFRPGRFLGSNFDPVFKGWIDEPSLAAAKPGTGTAIAVKKINQQGDHQGHHEWLAKINYLGLLNHPNLVKLIGYCIEDNDRYLVSEFTPQEGSLENLLFRRDANFKPLSWNLRIKVALGAAKGLAYLHNQEPKTKCCNIKSSNILVDSDHNAKLSNFWLTKDVEVIGLYTSDTIKESVVSTSRYAAPEYLATGHFTARSDIYSFGVVLLEVSTGKQNNAKKYGPVGEQMLVDFARPYLDQRCMQKIIDHSIKGQYPPVVAMKFAMILRRCLSRNPENRPTADKVVKALEGLQELQNFARLGFGVYG